MSPSRPSLWSEAGVGHLDSPWFLDLSDFKDIQDAVSPVSFLLTQAGYCCSSAKRLSCRTPCLLRWENPASRWQRRGALTCSSLPVPQGALPTSRCSHPGLHPYWVVACVFTWVSGDREDRPKSASQLPLPLEYDDGQQEHTVTCVDRSD